MNFMKNTLAILLVMFSVTGKADDVASTTADSVATIRTIPPINVLGFYKQISGSSVSYSLWLESPYINSCTFPTYEIVDQIVYLWNRDRRVFGFIVNRKPSPDAGCVPEVSTNSLKIVKKLPISADLYLALKAGTAIQRNPIWPVFNLTTSSSVTTP